MLTLALDTSTRTASVALGEEGRPLAESQLPVRATHSETVLPEVDRLLRACGRRPGELEAVAVGAGPGSFTGVRIAASLAKGLCFARELPLFAFSSLAAIAAGAPLGAVCAMQDARRGQVYAAAYRLDAAGDGLAEIFPPAVAPLNAVLERLSDPGEWLFSGGGALRHAVAVRTAGGTVLPPHLSAPRAGALLWLAHAFPETGRVRDVGSWEPRYVRLPAAEREEGAT